MDALPDSDHSPGPSMLLARTITSYDVLAARPEMMVEVDVPIIAWSVQPTSPDPSTLYRIS